MLHNAGPRFGEDRMKFSGQTDRQTDRKGDSFIAPITSNGDEPEQNNIPPLLRAPPSSHVIQLTGTIFELNSHINKTNVLTNFHDDWEKIVTS
ncbi:hypothetical protein DPMN_180556 [Dreissena polymorpha]|uniref:Uncharacterized protein n=1 Tax=Dreissena polymorpha TaxID=45954 RepID=A0A9D4INC6_DREPO|nr:hypothetical protein DPMN_180556 [Dreissena polymorpha]